jgi:hypothetical protein
MLWRSSRGRPLNAPAASTSATDVCEKRLPLIVESAAQIQGSAILMLKSFGSIQMALRSSMPRTVESVTRQQQPSLLIF